MNDSFSDDTLISAYFDGETTPAESEAAERMLSQSEKAHRQLAAFGLLSELLQDLPREEAPQVLASHVLKLAERRSLLADVGAPQSVASAKSVSWGDIWLPVVAVAAVVAVLVLPFGPQPNMERALVTSTESTIDGLAMDGPHADGGGSLTSPERLANRTAFEEATGSVVIATNEPENAPATEVPEPLDAVALEEDEDFVRQLKSLSLQAVSTAEQEELVFRESLKDLPVGTVVSAISTTSDPDAKVAVVKLWVVDRQQGADKLQVLLSREATPADVSEKDSGERGSGKKESSPAQMQASDLVAVYVEATNEQLVSALDRMREEETFVGLSVQEPVPVPSSETELAASGSERKPADANNPSLLKAQQPPTISIRTVDRFGKSRPYNGVPRIRVHGNNVNSVQIVVTQQAENAEHQQFAIRIQTRQSAGAGGAASQITNLRPSERLREDADGKSANPAKERPVPVLFLVQEQSVTPHR